MAAISDFFRDCDIMVDTSDNFDTFLGPLSLSQQKMHLTGTYMCLSVPFCRRICTCGGREEVKEHRSAFPSPAFAPLAQVHRSLTFICGWKA